MAETVTHFLIGDTPVRIFQSKAIPAGFVVAVSQTCKYCHQVLEQASNPCLANEGSGQHAPSIELIDCRPEVDPALPP